MAHLVLVLTFVYFCCKKLTHSLFSSYNDVNIQKINYAYDTYVIGKITYVSYMRSHLSFVYNFLVTNLSVQIYTTYRYFLKYENNETHYLLFSKAQQISAAPSTAYTVPCCWTSRHLMMTVRHLTTSSADRQRTVNCVWRYNLEFPCQCTANITYNLAAVVDI